MVEKGIRGGICQAIHRHARAINKYMKNYNKGIESSYLECLDVNSLYGLGMPQKLPVNGFKWIKIYTNLIKTSSKNYDVDSDKGYILEVDVEYPKNLHDLLSDLPLLAERMKINKCKKLVCNINGKESYVVHIKAPKKALNHGLIFRKVHGVIQFKPKQG